MCYPRLLLSSLLCLRSFRRPREKGMVAAVLLVSSYLLTIDENLPWSGLNMSRDYSGRRFQCPRYHSVWVCDHYYIQAVSLETITPVNKSNSLYREAEGGAKSPVVMQKTGHSYKVEVLSPRKCQATYLASASNHEE